MPVFGVADNKIIVHFLEHLGTGQFFSYSLTPPLAWGEMELDVNIHVELWYPVHRPHCGGIPMLLPS